MPLDSSSQGTLGGPHKSLIELRYERRDHSTRGQHHRGVDQPSKCSEPRFVPLTSRQCGGGRGICVCWMADRTGLSRTFRKGNLRFVPVIQILYEGICPRHHRRRVLRCDARTGLCTLCQLHIARHAFWQNSCICSQARRICFSAILDCLDHIGRERQYCATPLLLEATARAQQGSPGVCPISARLGSASLQEKRRSVKALQPCGTGN